MTKRSTSLPGIVVEPAWLESRLGDAGLRIVDMREAEPFRRAHVPSAVQLGLTRLGTNVGGLDNVLLPPDDFAALMEELGISSESTVIAYDDQWGLAAARLVWALHRYGHRTVAVLNGGWDRWQEEGRPREDTLLVPERARFRAEPDDAVAATTDWLAARTGADGIVLLDTRTPGEFEQGHLPRAKPWDWFNAVPAGAWNVAREVGELRSEWTELGVSKDREVVVYCRSGMRAAHTYVALKLAGYDHVRLYDGSWQEWSMTEGVRGEP